MKQTNNTRPLLAIDPGRQKFGYAILKQDKMVLTKGIAATDDLDPFLRMTLSEYPIDRIVLGDRTGSQRFGDEIRRIINDRIHLILVDEDFSSLEGRVRYLKDHRKGWRRLLPLSLQAPTRPFDDYVAVVLGERYLEGKLRTERG